MIKLQVLQIFQLSTQAFSLLNAFYASPRCMRYTPLSFTELKRVNTLLNQVLCSSVCTREMVLRQ